MEVYKLYLFRSPRAWKEVPIVIAMQRDVEHRGVVVECLLGAVAMVNVLMRISGGCFGQQSKL